MISLWEEFGIILYPRFVIIINLKQTGIKPAEQTRIAKVDIERYFQRVSESDLSWDLNRFGCLSSSACGENLALSTQNACLLARYI